MNFDWNSNTIEWYQAANEYSGFFKNIANLIAPKLEGYSTFCDIGCGLGLIDLELSKSINNITCIDINENAIEALKKSIVDKNISNIKPCLMDCQDIKENWDVIYTSFFGGLELENFIPHCKKLISVVNKRNLAELYPDKYRRFQKRTTEEVAQELTQKGITYSFREASFEFGQPLLSRQDARDFVKTQAPGITTEDLEAFLSLHLRETGELKYPFLIPRTKSMGIFEIEGEL
ncbi:class I SAM-dependent methyltransferase [Desulfitobacterium sp.]|uniref:class I SAM-dependent methyltransferase n=1 Tax=Desulfitobacterium sp. TaxID=49981 RepID=UPI002B202923|nr:class I SAM-dependent methyltransferase [Desulfitobacterium sp.]MEA4902959.1 class I SAM-dependent methyltransferase [Desulfitobacterium sp.]